LVFFWQCHLVWLKSLNPQVVEFVLFQHPLIQRRHFCQWWHCKVHNCQLLICNYCFFDRDHCRHAR
jgi:hypothetical protein